MTSAVVPSAPPAPPPRKLFGALCALGGAACWGGSSSFAKLVMDEGVHGGEAAGLLYVGAAVGLALLLALRHWLTPAAVRATESVPVRRRDLYWLAGAAFVGAALAPTLMMYGMAHTSGLAAALLIAVEPPATALIAVALFRERLTRRLVVGGLIVLAGSVLVSAQPGQSASATTLGALAVAGACTLWSLDSNLTTRIAHLDPLLVAMAKGSLAAPVVLVVAAPGRGAPFWNAWTMAQALQMLAVGFVGYGLGPALMVRAFRELGAARTGALLASTSLFAALSAIVVLGEVPTRWIVAAAVVITLGVALIVTEKH